MQRSSVAVLPEIGKRRDSQQMHVAPLATRKHSVNSETAGWGGEQVAKKSGPIEVKTSPWQLVTPSADNKCAFVVCCPTEMFDLPDSLRQEILRLHGTKAGFVIFADNGCKFDQRRRRTSVHIKSFVFIPYNVQAYETFPWEAEQDIKRYFDPPKYNLALTATIRLKTGSLKSTPNGVIAMVGSFQRLKNEMARAALNTTIQKTALHVLILPLTVRLYDIVDFVTEALTNQSVDTSAHLMKVGPQLITFSELYTTTNAELTHVLISVSMQHDPHAGSGAEGEYYQIDFPGAMSSRSLGETTIECVSRKLYEETGIAYHILDEDGVMNMLSLDRTMLTVVEELESDQPIAYSHTSPSASMKSGGTGASSVGSLPGLVPSSNGSPFGGGAGGAFSPVMKSGGGGGGRKSSGINVGGFIFDNSDVLKYTMDSVESLTTGLGSQQPTVLSMEEYNEMCSGGMSGGEEDIDSWD